MNNPVHCLIADGRSDDKPTLSYYQRAYVGAQKVSPEANVSKRVFTCADQAQWTGVEN